MKSIHTQVTRITQWLLVATVFLLPWQTRYIVLAGELQHDPWEYGTVSFYAVDIVITALIIFAAGHQLMERKQFRLSAAQVFAVALAGLAFISILLAGNKINAFFWCTKLIEGVLLFIFIPGLPLSHRFVAWAFTAAGVLQSVLAYIQFTTQQVIGSKWVGMATQLPQTLGVIVIENDLGRVLRAYGSFPHPNMLAGFLLISALACLFLHLHTQRMSERLLSAASLSLIGAGLWLTFSRQAWVSLAVIIVILVIVGFITVRQFPNRLALGIFYLLLPLITLTLIFPSLITTRTAASTPLEQKSLHERSDYIAESTTLLKENWVAGVGIGNYTAELHGIDKENDTLRPGYAYQPVHNIYLLLFTELGVFGLLLFAGLVGGLLYKAAFESPWSLAWGLGGLAFLLIGFVDHYLWSLHSGIILFWLVFALYEHQRTAK